MFRFILFMIAVYAGFYLVAWIAIGPFVALTMMALDKMTGKDFFIIYSIGVAISTTIGGPIIYKISGGKNA